MSRYSDYVEKLSPHEPIVPTDWSYVQEKFDDIIQGEIVSGNYEGHERYPQVRKTIRIRHGGGILHASEYIHDRKGEAARVLQFEYDWQYNPENPQSTWKFHYDSYHPESYWTITKHFHEHDQPTPLKTGHSRLPNFSHRHICAVLETIRVSLRVGGKLPIP